MDNLTVLDMFREAPVRSAMLTTVPLCIALAQLANSAVNDLSFVVSVPFAVVLVGYTSLLTQYGFVRFRRRKMEQGLAGYERQVSE